MDSKSRNIDQEKLLDKMRLFRDIRDEQLEAINPNSRVENVKYLGKINYMEERSGKNKIMDIFIFREIVNGKIINKVYDESMELLGIDDDKFGGFIPEKDHLGKTDMINELKEIEDNEILNLSQIENDRLEKIAAALGIKKEDLKKVSEIDLNKNIEDQIKEDKSEEIGKEDSKSIISGKQEIKLDTKVNDQKTLGQKLDLNSENEKESKYTKIVVVESDELKDIDKNSEVNNTRYSFVAVRADGTARVINDKLELDPRTGNNGMEESIKIDADGKARKDNSTLSRYKINGKDEYLSVENGKYGEVNVFYGTGRTRDGDMAVETQLETSNVWPTTRELRDTQREYGGEYHADNKQKEFEKHEKYGEKEVDLKDADGDKNTKTHDHELPKETFDLMVDRIMENNKIDDGYTREEVEEKLQRDIEKKKEEEYTLGEIMKATEEELEKDLEHFPQQGRGSN